PLPAARDTPDIPPASASFNFDAIDAIRLGPNQGLIGPWGAMVYRRIARAWCTLLGRPKWEPRFENSLNAVEDRMRNRQLSVAACAGVVMAGLLGAIEMRTLGQPAPAAQAPAPTAPPDTAALRAQYEQWRTEFKTWGKWAPLG